jgi:hypothetical protein
MIHRSLTGRTMRGRQFSRALAFAASLAGAVAAGVAAAQGKGPAVWSFDNDKIGGPPAGFEFAVTARKHPGKWVIVKDGNSQVLARRMRHDSATLCHGARQKLAQGPEDFRQRQACRGGRWKWSRDWCGVTGTPTTTRSPAGTPTAYEWTEW